MIKTYSLTKQFLVPRKIMVDASNAKFGRLATYIAKLLSKNQNNKNLFSSYTTNIVIINLIKIEFLKLEKKKLDYNTLKCSFFKTIKKMLPKNSKYRIKYLNCYKTIPVNIQISNKENKFLNTNYEI